MVSRLKTNKEIYQKIIELKEKLPTSFNNDFSNLFTSFAQEISIMNKNQTCVKPQNQSFITENFTSTIRKQLANQIFCHQEFQQLQSKFTNQQKLLNESVNNLLENFFNDENWSLDKANSSPSKKLHFYNINNDIAVIHYYFSDLKVSNKVLITHQAKLITLIHFYMLLKNNLGILFGYSEEKIGTLWLTSKKYFDSLKRQNISSNKINKMMMDINMMMEKRRNNANSAKKLNNQAAPK